MAFTALYEDEERGAWSVPKGEDAYCTDCGEAMYIQSQAVDGTARHFNHYSKSDCGGGESDDHKKWKNFAAERLNEIFGDRATERASVEEALAAPMSDKERRAADACVFFENHDRQFGRGLAVEVQHKNDGKDKLAVERDYNQQGVATLWLSGDDFSDTGLPMNEVDIRARVREQTRICELCPKWELVVGRYSRAEQPETHEQLIYETHDPRERERSVPATIPRHWCVPTTGEHWRSTDWAERFRTVDEPYQQPPDRGDHTCIDVTIPPLITDEDLEQLCGKYTCRDCAWKGDEYALLDDGSAGGTAVCPNCRGGLLLSSAVDAGVHG